MERIRSAINPGEYEADKSDPGGAALAFTVKVLSTLYRNNTSDIVRDPRVCKGLTIKLIGKLDPSDLLEGIRETRDCWTAEQRSNL